MSKTDRKQPPIAIVGIGALFPDSPSLARFWGNIVAAADLITDIPETHFKMSDYYSPDLKAPDKTYAKRGGFLPDIPFDSLGFGIPPNLLSQTDTSQLLALLCARTTLEDAFGGEKGFEKADKSRISCLLGVTSGQELFGQMASRLRRPEWIAGMRAAGLDQETAEKAADKIGETMVPWTESTFPGLLGNVVAGRICNRLDLGGTNAVCDAACASSFAALSMGLDELILDKADMVLAGGVDTLNDIFMHMCFSKTPALSMSGVASPFGKDGDGTLLGEGIGMLALKRLEDAEAAGDKIYAVIKGIGSSSDGRSKSVYAPVSEGQSNALKRAYSAADVNPATIELVEAHGTGTKAGDVAEVGGLKLAFEGAEREDKQWCALGSVKSQIGHTKSTAGAAGLIKAAMALHEKVLPPTLNVSEPNPKADFPNSPFYVNTKSRPWVRGDNHPRRAGVSAFGFGGSNFHVLVEEYTGTKGKKPGRFLPRSVETFCISGPTRATLAEEANIIAARLQKSEKTLREEAQTASKKFKSTAKRRLVVVARDPAEAAKLLSQAADALDRGEDPVGPAIAFGEGEPGKVAFVFPGQGSQYVGMAGDLAMAFPEALDALGTVDFPLLEGADVPLSRVMLPPQPFSDEEAKAQHEKLKATEWAQPALGAAELAILAVCEKLGLKPDFVAGHSFGELTALCAAGVFSKNDLMKVARKRGLLMAAASDIDGAMAAVSASAEQVNGVIKDLKDVVLANENAPKQTVIAGPTASVEKAMAKLKEAGMKARRLEVSTAFHSPLVSDAVPQLRKFLDGIDIKKPSIPVYANATAGTYPNKADGIRDLLASQVGKSVKFVDEINAMYDAGARLFIEVGPGSVLSGLVGRILEDKKDAVVVSTDARSGDTTRAVMLAIARAAANGAKVDFNSLFEGFEPEPKRKKGKLEVMINGSNYGKPAMPEPAPVTVGDITKVKAAPAPAPAARPAAPAAAAPAKASAAAPAKASAPAPTQAAAHAQPAARPAGAVNPPSSINASVAPAQLAAPTKREARPMTSPPNTPPDGGWLAVFREGQRQTADAHNAFQQAIAETHVAFLQAYESSSAQLAAVLSGQQMPPSVQLQQPQRPQQALPPAQPQQAYAQPQAVYAQAPAAQPAPVAQPAPAPTNGAAASYQAPVAAKPAPAPAAAKPAPVAAKPAPAPAAAGPNVTETFLEIVADKTGYPRDALDLDMELEADLGIDSIKRVEILSALKESAPGLPDLDAMEASQLRTLKAIADALGAGAAGASAPAAGAAAPAAAGGGGNVTETFLEIVADKTGYPRDALDLSMELEADLGIDSIKRVEILSALKESAPGLPDLDAMEASQLRTLQAIADALSPGGAAAPAAAALAAAPAGGGASSEQVLDMFLEVVADKTGYPRDALDLSMELEADLGIDSIKRVEILSALKETAPDLPDLDAMQASQLRTLQAIADALSGGAGSAASTGTETGNGDSRTKGADDDKTARAAQTFEETPPGKAGRPQLPAGRAVAVRTPKDKLTKALIGRLNKAGVKAVALDEGELNGQAAQIGGLVVVCGGFKKTDRALEDLKKGFFDVQKTGPSLKESLKEGGALLFGVQLSGKAGDRAGAVSGGLGGLIKTAALEWAGVACKVIDTDESTADALADTILAELDDGVEDREVRYRAGKRMVRVFSKVAPGAPMVARKERPTAVVTGGARGVTAVCVIDWAKQTKGKIALFGRTPLADEPVAAKGAATEGDLVKVLFAEAKKAGEKIAPAAVKKRAQKILAQREIRGTIAAIKAAGGEAAYITADAGDRDSVNKGLDEVREKFGPIHVLVHGAGVLADRHIEDKTAEQLDMVLGTKASGALYLLELTDKDPIDTICFFASVAGVTGNAGQCDYAMANEVLGHLADSELAKRPNARVRSLAWGPWEGGMVTPELAAHFAARGVPLIPLAGGARVFVEELEGEPRSPGLVEVVGATLDGMAPLPRTVRLRLSGERLKLLDDHRIRGGAVLPAALASELMLEAGRRVLGERPAELQDVNVLRGVRLDEGPLPEFIDFNIEVAELGGKPTATLRLDGDKGPRYRAVLATEAGPAVGKAPSVAPTGATLDKPLYPDRLFHGPLFHVVDKIEGSDGAGMKAAVVGRGGKGWPDDGKWMLDVAAVDAGLQLLLLYGEDQTGHGYLPTKVARVVGGTEAIGKVKCLLAPKEVTRDKVHADLWFVDEQGNVPLALLDAVAIRIPDAQAAAGAPA